jgi:Fur family ferric uptake transcriptional regulator
MSMRRGHKDICQQFKVIFEQEGLDRIDERLAILEAFLGTEDHVTAAELSMVLKEQGSLFPEEFIVENLKLFFQYGFAQEKQFTDQVPRYEHRHLGKHHDHLVCVRCGAILEFFNPNIEALQAETTRRMGFHDLQHRMDIYGLCSNCLGKRKEVMPLVMASPSERVRIVGFRGGKGMERRLTSMGLNRDAQVEVIKSNGPGPLIVASRETRIALGVGMAKKILVTTIDTPEPGEGRQGAQRLNELKTGEKAIIERVQGRGRFRHRLMEMGFVPGAEIVVQKCAPLKDPIEYVLKGYHVSLRHEEAEKVLVRKAEEETRED